MNTLTQEFVSNFLEKAGSFQLLYFPNVNSVDIATIMKNGFEVPTGIFNPNYDSWANEVAKVNIKPPPVPGG